MKEFIIIAVMIIMSFASLTLHADINKTKLAEIASDNLAKEIAFGAGLIEKNVSRQRTEKLLFSDKDGNDEAVGEFVKEYINIGLDSGSLKQFKIKMKAFDLEEGDANFSVNLILDASDLSKYPFLSNKTLKGNGMAKKSVK